MGSLRLSAGAIAALAQSVEIDPAAHTLTVVHELDPDVYQELRTVFTGYGAKYKSLKRPRAQFKFAADPTPIVEIVRATGEGNPLEYYWTPAPVVDWMIESVPWDALPDHPRILEPSAGSGGILIPFLAACQERGVAVGETVAVERNPAMANLLKRRAVERLGEAGAAIQVVTGDWLETATPDPFHIVVMNPPFSGEADSALYATHIYKAFRALCEDWGALLAVTPLGWTFHQERGKPKPIPLLGGTKVTSTQFRRLVGEHGEFRKLESGLFLEAGTGIATALALLRQGACEAHLPDIPDVDAERIEQRAREEEERTRALPHPMVLMTQIVEEQAEADRLMRQLLNDLAWLYKGQEIPGLGVIEPTGGPPSWLLREQETPDPAPAPAPAPPEPQPEPQPEPHAVAPKRRKSKPATDPSEFGYTQASLL